MNRRERKKRKSGPSESESHQPTSQPSRARDRVVKRMKRLLVAGAAVGLGACHGEESPPVVCDPMPPPVDCNGEQTLSYLLEHAYFWAEWREVTDLPYIYVRLQLDSTSGDQTVFDGDPTAQGAEIDNIGRYDEGPSGNPKHLAFDLKPEEHAEMITVRVTLDCGGYTYDATLELDVSSPPSEEGESLSFMVYDEDGNLAGEYSR